MARFVLFDLDNTLVDRQHVFLQWARAFAADRNLQAEAVQALCEADNDGFASRETVFEIARSRLNLKEPIADLIAEYRLRYPKFFEPDPTVLDALRKLRSEGFRIGVVTNGPVSQNEKIERVGLQPLIDGLCVSEDFGVEKPDPRIFAEAIRRCCGAEVSANKGWMVGDSAECDIAGAREIGLRTVWISRGRVWAEKQFTPDVIASKVSDAVEFILNTTCDW
jgi:HAD superfamily hydrolase (TIGR01549 family)